MKEYLNCIGIHECNVGIFYTGTLEHMTKRETNNTEGEAPSSPLLFPFY
jgi:hypothetical protein